MARLATLILAATSVGCLGQSIIDLPESGGLPTTLLIAIPPVTEVASVVDAPPRALAIDNQAFTFTPWRGIGGASYVAVFSDATLAELQLEPGLLTLVSGVGRSFASVAARIEASDDGAASTWGPASPDVLPMRWELPPLDLGVCLTAGGCLTSSTAVSRCVACAAPSAIDPPVPPECPIGWQFDGESCLGGDPEVGPCPAGEVWLPSSGGCVPITAPCPAGRWPAVPAGAQATLYVDAGAAGPGDGSIDLPYPTIVEALAQAPAQSAIVVARGVYEAQLTVTTPNLAIVGACAGETRVVGPDGAEAILVQSEGISLQGFTVHGDWNAVAVAGAGSEAHLVDIVARAETATAIQVSGAALTGSRIHVLRAGASALASHDGAVVSVERLVVDGRVEHAVGCRDDSTLQLTDLVVQSAMAHGGVHVADNCHVSVRNARIDDARGGGVTVIGAAEVDIDRVLIRGTMPGRDSHGLLVLGGIVTASRLHIDSITGNGVVAGQTQGAVVRLRDTVIRSTRMEASYAGYGLFVGGTSGGPTPITLLVAERLFIADSAVSAIRATSQATLSVTDYVIDGAATIGIDLVNFARTEFRRGSITKTQVAVHSDSWRMPLILTDLSIRNVDGEGVLHRATDSLTILRGRIVGAQGAGVAVEPRSAQSRSSTISLSHLVVEGTRALGEEPQAGLRMVAAKGQHVSRFRLQGNGEFGAWLVKNTGLEVSAHFRDGVISGHEVGINAPISDLGGYAVEPLIVGVQVQDNRLPLAR